MLLRAWNAPGTDACAPSPASCCAGPQAGRGGRFLRNRNRPQFGRQDRTQGQDAAAARTRPRDGDGSRQKCGRKNRHMNGRTAWAGPRQAGAGQARARVAARGCAGLAQTVQSQTRRARRTQGPDGGKPGAAQTEATVARGPGADGTATDAQGAKDARAGRRQAERSTDGGHRSARAGRGKPVRDADGGHSSTRAGPR